MPMTALEKAKTKLDINDTSHHALLDMLLDDAKEYILAYTNRPSEKWIPAFNSVQIQIAVINYNRLGVEGAISRSEGGISTSFSSGSADYPDSVIKTLNPYRLARVL